MTDKKKLDKLVAEIEKKKQLIWPKNDGQMKAVGTPEPLEQGWLNALKWMKDIIDSMQKEAKKDAAVKVEQIMAEVDMKFQKFAKECKATQVDTTIRDITENHFDEMLGEESTNDDLEEAAKKAGTQTVGGKEKFFWNDYHKFKDGANWQQQKYNRILKELLEIANQQDGCLALEALQLRISGLIKV